jgi:biotin carboxyl carrier protein
VVPLGHNRYLVINESGSRLAHATVDHQRTWVFLEGWAYVVEDRSSGRPNERLHHADDTGALAAPMPATVVHVRVAAGDRVVQGDVLVTLEAMKMELPIVAPRDAVVKAVRCAPGDLIQAGAPLVELE